MWRTLSFFFFNDTATTEIYTLSLHDALPIFRCNTNQRSPSTPMAMRLPIRRSWCTTRPSTLETDRKSTRLNSSHSQISYAVFCLKKKNYHPHRPLLVVQICHNDPT